MIIVTIITILLYCIIIGAFIIGFNNVKKFESKSANQKNSFSIIIPFRNEAQNLCELLESLKSLNYSFNKYEIIFVDDNSTDNSVEIIEIFSTNIKIDIKILKNEQKTNSPKKDAINTAIRHAKYDWIITTDADCIVPKNWLNIFDNFIQEKAPKLIIAPVTYNKTKTFLDRFQLLDFLSLQGATIGAFGINKPFLCNGANLCYNKAVFKEVNGFQGNYIIASGDDIFLLEKVLKKYPNKVNYLKSLDALVSTKPQLNFKDLKHQRIRWAAKSTGYKNRFSKLVALAVLAINLLLILLLVLTPFGHFKWYNLLSVFIIKYLIDAILLFKTTSFFNQKKVLSSYFLSSIIYPFFTMFVVIASLTSEYQWKGRQFKK